MNLTASIIIPFYGKCNILEQTLQSLSSQTDKNFEIIIIDDGSPESFEKVVPKYSKTLIIKYFRIKNIGRAGARNFGAKKADSTHLIFLDSDMIVENNWFKKNKKHLFENPNIIIVGQGFRDPKNTKSKFDKFLVKIEQPLLNKNKNLELITYCNFKFSACNLVISKKTYIDLNGFDESLSDGEDFDFGIRLLKNQSIIYIDSSIIIHHNDWPSLIQFINRSNQYLKGKKALIQKNTDYAKYFPDMNYTNQHITLKTKLILLLSKIINPITINDKKILYFLPNIISNILIQITISSLTKKIEKK